MFVLVLKEIIIITIITPEILFDTEYIAFSVYFPLFFRYFSDSSVIVKTCVFLSILFGRINFYVYFCTE